MEEFDIVIIDDDPMAGELTKDLLTDEGWKVLLVDDSMKAIDEIKKYKPKLVISDIMMPGINGMEICKRIKTNPETKAIKVIILSGKSYESEKQRALMLGADYFIGKPYDVANFSKTIKEIIQGSSKTSPPPPPPIKKSTDVNEEKLINSEISETNLRITAYGIRGLGERLPTSDSIFGRQTNCISIETQKDIIVLDAGTGIFELGQKIVEKNFYRNIWIFLTHFHIDNIMGLPHFKPFLDSKYTINIIGPNDPEKSLKDAIKNYLYSSFSPIPHPPKAKINLYEVLEENYSVSEDIKMATMYSNHPTTTMIYLLNIKGFKIAYAPDSEIWEESTAFQDYNERLGKFTSKFDLIIHDSYYDKNDYIEKNHKGHSSFEILCNFVRKNHIKNLMPINLNPSYEDEKIKSMIEEGSKILSDSGSKILLLKEKEKTLFEISAAKK